MRLESSVVVFGLAYLLSATGCASGNRPSAFPDGDSRNADAPGQSELVAGPPDTVSATDTPDWRGAGLPEAKGEDLSVELSCEPGSLGFRCPCMEKSDCESGWCVFHLGGKVCSMNCAEECPPTFQCRETATAGTDTGTALVCQSAFASLCLPCIKDADCPGSGDRCVLYPEGKGAFCGGKCGPEKACPAGYECKTLDTILGGTAEQCMNSSGECACSNFAVAELLGTTCSIANEHGVCPGWRQCGEAGLGECDADVPQADTCDGDDNDCDDSVDEGAPCVDNNPCTIDDCAGKEGCVHQPISGDLCSDGDLCTEGEVCVEGQCLGEPTICEDNNPCTKNGCEAQIGCTWEKLSAPVECPDDGEPCTLDVCSDGICTHPAGNDGTSCQDDDPCTNAEYCSAGACLPGDYLPECISCGDGVCMFGEDYESCKPDCGFCGDKTCGIKENQLGICPQDCLTPCGNGVCEGGEDSDLCKVDCGGCGDGLCGWKESNSNCPGDCEPGCGNGVCEATETPDTCPPDCMPPCGDKICEYGENPIGCPADCTVCGDSVCGKDEDKATCPLDCTPACGNGKCEGGESFDSCKVDCGFCGDAVCGFIETWLNCPPDCFHNCGDGICLVGIENDENCPGDCIIDSDADSIPDKSDNCPLSDNPNQEDADEDGEGDACDWDDDDDGELDVTDCAPFDAFVSHLVDEVCDGVDNDCSGDPDNDLDCDDGNLCTKDWCAGVAGCKNVLVACGDSNPCTDDSCAPEMGCVNTPNDANDCSNNDVCDGQEVCVAGGCVQGVPLQCDDDNPCTDDECDDVDGCVYHVNDDNTCLDDHLCNGKETCVGGACVPGKPMACNDGNLCTDDWCVPTDGCVSANNSVPCDDGDTCTTEDTCMTGTCQGTGSLDCDDGNLCTDSICDPEAGCLSTDNSDACDDGDECTWSDKCVGGKCVGTVDVVCNDGKTCTSDMCDPQLGCIYQVDCPAGQTCSQGGKCCQLGECGWAGRECGLLSDGCGGEFDCGKCAEGETCVEGVCSDGACSGKLVGSIGGEALDLAVWNDYAVVALGYGGIRTLDLAMPQQPVLAGKLQLAGRAQSVHVASGYAYVSGLDIGIQVVNLADPTMPILEGSCDTPGSAFDVVVVDATAYVADGNKGLTIVDVQTPSNPVVVGNLGTAKALHSVEAAGGHAYACDQAGALEIVNVSDPVNPESVKKVDQIGCLFHAIHDDHAFVGGPDLLTILDIGVPVAPAFVATYPVPGSVKGIAVLGELVLLATADTGVGLAHDGGLVVVDVSEPKAPKAVGIWTEPGEASGVAMAAGAILLTDASRGIYALVGDTPSKPTFVGRWQTTAMAWDVQLDDVYAYVADAAVGVLVVDVHVPETPHIVGRQEPPGQALGLRVGSGFVFAAAGEAGLTVFDVSDPASPQVVGQCETPGTAQAVELYSAYALVADDQGLQVVDVSNPAEPTLKASHKTLDAAHDVCVHSYYAYVANGSGMHGLEVVYIGDPGNPSFVDNLGLQGTPLHLHSADNYVFMGAHLGGVLVFDVGAPNDPVLLGGDALGFEWQARGVDVRHGKAFVADTDSGLRILDVSDPWAPEHLDMVESAGFPEAVATAHGYAYLAAHDGGLQVYDVSGCWDGCGFCGAHEACSGGQCQCKHEECGDECCGPEAACHQGKCCQTNCQGKECGTNGCGGKCGICLEPQYACKEGICICAPDCSGKQCGTDGCEGFCGECAGLQALCLDGQCTCVPDCLYQGCGDGGCPGSPNACGLCPQGESCLDGNCAVKCDDGLCGGNETCETCPQDCGDCCGNGVCLGDMGETCVDCPADCGPCCPNDLCDNEEDCDTCPADCGECENCDSPCGNFEHCCGSLGVCVADMVPVPGGPFWMGCNSWSGSSANDDNCDQAEHPYHEVQTDTFEIDITEVTTAQFTAFLDTGLECKWKQKSYKCVESNIPTGSDQAPAVGVTWFGAHSYCQWVEKRLCTEAEWEKAARGGCDWYAEQQLDCKADSRLHPWSNQWPSSCDGETAVYSGCSCGGPCQVGGHPGGVSPSGALDMAGNVFEWVADWYGSDYYCKGPMAHTSEGGGWTYCAKEGGADPSVQKNPTGPPEGSFRIIRGGSYKEGQQYCRVSARPGFTPTVGFEDVGLRCCRTMQ